jgi:hypothetical protein
LKNNEIVLASPPKGVFLEGIIGDTSKPGTVMQVSANVAPVSGRHTWVAYNPSADGDPRVIAVLIEDHLQGKNVSDAYVNGTRCFLYVPLPGEEVNVLTAGQAGTGSANEFDIGDRFVTQHGTGKQILQSVSANAAHFLCLEEITQVPVDTDTLVWCMRQ